MAGWYAIQVIKGKEEAMVGHIDRVLPAGLLRECFFPRFATEMKLHGAWIPVEKPLFPGYLIAETDDPAALDRALGRMEGFARVLRQGDVYVPLAREERELIESFTEPGERVVPMSMGFKDGDAVVVTKGPLVGRQGFIRGINRRKSIAYLELDLCGRTVRTRVGLGVLSGEGSARARRAKLFVEEARKERAGAQPQIGSDQKALSA